MSPVSDPRKDDWSTEGSALLRAPLVPPTPEEERLVRFACHRNATNPAEEQMFLSMLFKEKAA